MERLLHHHVKLGDWGVWSLPSRTITVQYPLHFTESCPSGRRSTIGNRVGVKSVSGVQIPDSPPADSRGILFRCSRCRVSPHAEGWQSGRLRRSRKPFTRCPRVRGFESLLLRQIEPTPRKGRFLVVREEGSEPVRARSVWPACRWHAGSGARPGPRPGRCGARGAGPGHPSSSARLSRRPERGVFGCAVDLSLPVHTCLLTCWKSHMFISQVSVSRHRRSARLEVRYRRFEQLAGRSGFQMFISPVSSRETGVLHEPSKRLR